MRCCIRIISISCCRTSSVPAFELPFEDGEAFGNAAGTDQFLNFLTEGGILRHVGSRYHWSAEEFPASEINLRSATAENFVIVDISNPAHHRVIGEMDRFTVPMLLHENAIYLQRRQPVPGGEAGFRRL